MARLVNAITTWTAMVAVLGGTGPLLAQAPGNFAGMDPGNYPASGPVPGSYPTTGRPGVRSAPYAVAPPGGSRATLEAPTAYGPDIPYAGPNQAPTTGRTNAPGPANAPNGAFYPTSNPSPGYPMAAPYSPGQYPSAGPNANAGPPTQPYSPQPYPQAQPYPPQQSPPQPYPQAQPYAPPQQFTQPQQSFQPRPYPPTQQYPQSPQVPQGNPNQPPPPYGNSPDFAGTSRGASVPNAGPAARNVPLRAERPVAVGASLPDSQLFEPAKIVARVGNEPILAGDILPQINQMLEPYKDKYSKEELAEQREKLMKQMLTSAVEYKLLYQDFLRTLPADKRNEVLANAEEKLFQEYDEKQLDKMLKNAKVSSPYELDAKLREYGSSLEKQKRDFMEQQLGRAQLSRNVEFNPEITHDDMLKRYHENTDEYAVVAAARWEQLTVKFENFPNKSAAFRAMAEMGNEVLRGAPFAAVAQRHSQDIHAEQGGLCDWTEQGSLVSETLDRALFTLPIGKMSQIIEDDRGFYILRVVERRDAGRVPFTEAQVEIKESLRKERIKTGVKEYLEKLKSSIHVWNIFEDGPAVDPVADAS